MLRVLEEGFHAVFLLGSLASKIVDKLTINELNIKF